MNTATRIALAVSLFTAILPLAANASPGPGTSLYFLPRAEVMGTATESPKHVETPAIAAVPGKPISVKMPSVEHANFDQINRDARRAAFQHLGTSL
jgi:hypothetical protein